MGNNMDRKERGKDTNLVWYHFKLVAIFWTTFWFRKSGNIFYSYFV